MNTTLDLHVNGTQLPTVKQPKILGVTFDSMFTFGPHAKNIQGRVQNRTNVLKSLAGSTWGKDKETLQTTYKAVGRPLLNYAAPIWSPQLQDSNWKKLQTAQNAALRAITSCHLMAH